MKIDTEVGYVYEGAFFCSPCMVMELIELGEVTFKAMDLDTEEVLDILAEDTGIDREDETSFSSGEFPKPLSLEERRKPNTSCCVCDMDLTA